MCCRWLVGGVLVCLVLLMPAATDAQDKSEELLAAVREGVGGQVEQLLDSGLKVDARDVWGKTPLSIAAASGDIAIVQLLLARGADINTQDNWHRTPLIAAVQANNTWLTDILIHQGADVNRQASNGISALLAAAQRGNTAAANMLIAAGASVNHRDNMGWTALMWAAGRDNTELVTLLLAAGADINAIDRAGKTARGQAEEHGYSRDMIELLRNQEALAVTIGPIDADSGLDPNSAYPSGKAYGPTVAGRATKGAANAPVTIVEYTDFQCPYCLSGAQVVEEVLEKYKGKVRLVLKHYPLEFHPAALPAALYFEALAQQDVQQAWLFQQRIFQAQDRLREGERFLKQVAAELGVDLKRLEEALASPGLKARIMADILEANNFGIDGVPAFLINGKLLDGAQPLDAFSRVIDEALAR